MDWTDVDDTQSYDNFTYRSENHQHVTFGQLNDLRCRGELCDVVLNVGNKRIAAHRIILLVCSPYFRQMFTGNLEECQKKEIPINDIDEFAMELLINFCYTSRIVINKNNVTTLLAVADYIQLTEIKDICCEFLKRQLNVSNCLEIHFAAETYSCPELLRVTSKYIGNNFRRIINSNKFQSLSVQQLISLISLNDLNVKSEELVFDSVVKWIEYNEYDRRIHLYKLLQYVQFPLLGAKIIITKVVANKWIQLDKKCCHLVNIAKKNLSKEQPVIQDPRPRSQYLPSQSLFIVGGYRNGAAMSSVERYNPDTGYWKLMAPLRKPRWGVGVGVLNGRLYAVGGHDGNNVLDNIEIYHPAENYWSDGGSSMTSGRTSIGVSSLQGHLYAVGGQNVNKCVEYAERFDPEVNQWQRISSMTTKRVGVAAVTLDNCIYAVGGFDGQFSLNTVERYDPRENKWIQITSMSTSRKHFGCAVLNNQIYAVGGSDNNSELSSVEMYDSRTNTWNSVIGMALNRKGVSVSTVNNEIYAIGGNNGKSNLITIEIYNYSKNEWRLCSATTNYDRFGSGVCSVIIN